MSWGGKGALPATRLALWLEPQEGRVITCGWPSSIYLASWVFSDLKWV